MFRISVIRLFKDERSRQARIKRKMPMRPRPSTKIIDNEDILRE